MIEPRYEPAKASRTIVDRIGGTNRSANEEAAPAEVAIFTEDHGSTINPVEKVDGEYE
jgi:hypothetical protein